MIEFKFASHVFALHLSRQGGVFTFPLLIYLCLQKYLSMFTNNSTLLFDTNQCFKTIYLLMVIFMHGTFPIYILL